MINNDYILQFHDELEKVVETKVGNVAAEVCDAWSVGGCDLSRIVSKYLWGKGLNLRDSYISTKGSDAVFEKIRLQIKSMALGNFVIDDAVAENKAWNEFLKGERGQILFFVSSKRMVEYMRPVLCSMKKPFVLLTMCNVNFMDELPNCATVVRFILSSKEIYHNELLAKHLPRFYMFVNTIGSYIEALSPRLLVCIDGCQLEYGVAALICKRKGIPSVCVQQGWPSFLHEGFHNMPYTHFMTWGRGFSELWKKRNVGVNFVDVGYLYNVKGDGAHNAITFFLQAPVYFLTKEYLNRIYLLIDKTAEKYDTCNVLVREHPVYKADERIKERWCRHKNLKVVSNVPLEDVYADTHVAVSCFSSSIMECVVHGCVPLVFCPTTGVRYNPDIEAEGLGFISDSEEMFFDSLGRIMEQEVNLEPLHNLSYWFENVGKSSVSTAIGCIENLSIEF